MVEYHARGYAEWIQGVTVLFLQSFSGFGVFTKEVGNPKHWTCGRRRLFIEIGVDTAAGEQATREQRTSELITIFSFLVSSYMCIACALYMLLELYYFT
jgi:hypothetical protein